LYDGSGCQGAHREILAVANKLKAPIAHTSRAKDFLEFDNPYNIGMTGMLGNEAGYHALLDCDALLMLGADFAWRQFYPDKAKIVQVDIDPTHLGRRHPITKGVVGDVKATLESLLPKLVERSDASFRATYVNRYAKYRESAASASRPLAARAKIKLHFPRSRPTVCRDVVEAAGLIRNAPLARLDSNAGHAVAADSSPQLADISSAIGDFLVKHAG
jgi:thiamine pyrophosphate-dependent acetolactate synthase large subunit-like protein